MRIIAADDSQLMLDALVDEICKAEPNAQVRAFRSASRLLAALEEETVDFDAAFLDIEMPGMNGLELAEKLKEINPGVNIIFVTAFPQYKGAAMDLRASGYIEKPVTAEAIRTELNNLRNPPERVAPKRLRVRTFGTFDVTVDGEELRFADPRTRELFAYLIDRRGASCSAGELLRVLWAEEKDAAAARDGLRDTVADLTRTLRDARLEDVVIKGRNQIAVNTKKISCDLYDFLEGDIRAVNAYFGEYMTDYAWQNATASGRRHR